MPAPTPTGLGRHHVIARGPKGDDEAGDDIVAAWERTECSALTVFRDAYDCPLPSPLADTVKRHFEAGVCRLERLRKMQAVG